MIKVTYHYSACVLIETAELSILCDPWFTEGIYDGSWFHYPPVHDPLGTIPGSDFVWISHIHPDHYDAEFLRAYKDAHPDARILVADFERNFLSRKMRLDGIDHEVAASLRVGETQLALIPNGSTSYDIDSCLVVRRGGHSVVNMNDNLFNQDQIDRIVEYIGGPPTIALMGYTGAGPYPQTYYTDREVLRRKAEQKKSAFLERYVRMRDALGARVTIPFAGKYILGGRLHSLNPYRGVADACEVLAIDERAVVLEDGGHASIDTSDLEPTAVRTEPYDLAAIEAYAASLAERPMAYETYFRDLPVSAMPLSRLLPKAFANAHASSVVTQDYYFCIRLGDRWFVGNAAQSGGECEFRDEVEPLQPRSELYLDPRYLFGLLTCVFHWNNAEVGSQYRTHRVPDEFCRDAQAFLSFFHV